MSGYVDREATENGHPQVTITEPEAGIITVTIDRGEKCNAITPQITEALWRAVDLLGDRDDLRCLVLTAVGEYFTSGIDLRFGAGNRPANPATSHLHPGWSYRRNYRSHHLLYDEMEALEKPIILAAQGPVLAWGVETAVSCDFRFCSPRAVWGLPEVHIGALPGSGGTSRLTRLVGPHWAKWMAVAGKQMSAEQALNIGLVHEIYPEGELLESVYAFCRELIGIPAETVGLGKHLVDLSADVHDRNVQRHLDRLTNTTLSNGSAEVLERTARFRKGMTPPGWQGLGDDRDRS
jgi:enoyl-CoA hydratase/carnithine racemase